MKPEHNILTEGLKIVGLGYIIMLEGAIRKFTTQ